MTGKKQSLSLEVKQKILCDVDDGILKKTAIATKYGIPASTLSTILKNREKIEAAYAINQFEPARKRMRTGKNEDIEVALLRWIQEVRSENIVLTGNVLQEKAKHFAEALGVNDFVCSNGWLSRFKERHNIVSKRICGEESSVDQGAVDSFFSETWPALKKIYAPRDIFNADETGLFFKAQPSSTLTLKGEKCSGGKHSKVRVTVMVACNMDGSEKLPLLVIGNSAKPRCFKGVKTLPVNYTSSKKAWMNKSIFTKWLLDLDLKFTKEKRKICLILDNCTAHKDVKAQLKSIKCVFLPPNTTSKIQPCDQGIIQCLKVHYRKGMIKKIIDCFDKRIPFSMDLLDAMCYLRKAWSSVSAETIKNCFRHGGFTDEGQSHTREMKETELEELINEAEKRGIASAPSFESYCQIDDEVMTSDVVTDQEIIDNLMEKKGTECEGNEEEDGDEEDDDPEIPPVQSDEAAKALQTVQRFLLQQENANSALNNLDKVDLFIKKCQSQNLKQSLLTDFFNGD